MPSLWRGRPGADEQRAATGEPMLDHLQAGLDAIDYGVALWTADRRLAWCNVKFRELFHGIADCLRPGLSHHEFLSRLARSNELATELPPEEWIARGLAEFEQGGVSEQMLSDGRFYEISRSVAAGGLRVTVVHDITPLKRGRARAAPGQGVGRRRRPHQVALPSGRQP